MRHIVPHSNGDYKKMLTSISGYKTYIVSFMVAVFGILEMTDWYTFMDNPGAGAVALISAILMAFLRTVTVSPPGVPASSVEEKKDE